MKKEVEGTAFLDPAFFNAIWERFKEKLAKANDTGIHVSAQAEDFEVLKDRVANFREMLLDNFDTTDNQNKAIVSALTTLLTYGKENNYKSDDIVSKLEELAAQGDIQKVLDALAEISTKNKDAAERIAKDFSGETEAKKIERENKKAAKELEKRRLQMEKEEEEKKQFQEADDAYDELMKKNIGTLHKLFWEVKEKNTNFSYIDPKGMRKMLTEKKLENKEYGRELVDYIVYKTFGFNPKAPSKKKTSGTGFALKTASKELHGSGLDSIDASNESKGHELASNKKDHALNEMIDQFELKKDVTKQNEGNFGKYNVRVNDLKRGFFNIRYPSGAVIRPFPKQLISTTLRNIIVQIIYEKKFSEEDYETLDIRANS